MPAARVVRIPSATPPPPVAPAAREDEPPREAVGALEVRRNLHGSQRAWRTFGGFLSALLAIYAAFLETFLTDPYGGVRSNPGQYAVFTAVMAAVGLYGFVVSVLRAPRELRFDAGELRVHERSGQWRRFPRGPGLSMAVLRSYPAGLLSTGPTEIVRLSMPNGLTRTYLVDSGWFPSDRASAGRAGPGSLEQVL